MSLWTGNQSNLSKRHINHPPQTETLSLYCRLSRWWEYNARWGRLRLCTIRYTITRVCRGTCRLIYHARLLLSPAHWRAGASQPSCTTGMIFLYNMWPWTTICWQKNFFGVDCSFPACLVPRPHPLRGKGSGDFRRFSWLCWISMFQIWVTQSEHQHCAAVWKSIFSRNSVYAVHYTHVRVSGLRLVEAGVLSTCLRAAKVSSKLPFCQ